METDRSIAPPRPAPEHPLFAVKRFDTPETVLTFDQGRLDVITIGGRLVAKGSYAPGWRWSHLVVPPRRSGTDPGGLVGVVLTGRAKMQVPGSLEVDLTPGDFFHVAAGYESWVVGYRPCEIVYVDGVAELLDRLHARG